MKKLTVLLAVVSTLAGSSVHAQNSMNAGGNASRGAGAKAGSTMANDRFAWGAAIGSIAVLGAVVGLVASAGASSSSSFSH